MRFLINESADARLGSFLQQHGHDVTLVARDYRPALPDIDVLAIARREHRILITNDRDFGEMIVGKQLAHAGVIYLRLGAATLQQQESRLQAVLINHSDDLDQFIVVTERRIRLRRTGKFLNG